MVGRAIAEADPERADERAALVAHHAERAGDPVDAARWLRRAAEWAGPINPAEALGHWRKLRTLLADLPPSSEALELQLAACGRVLSLGWRMGIPDTEQREALDAGLALAERAGSIPALVQMHVGYAGARGFGGDISTCLEHFHEAVRHSEEVDDPELQVVARFGTYWHYVAGDLRESLRAADWIIDRTSEDVTRGSGAFGFSPHTWLRMFKGTTLLPWMGRVEEASAELDRAVELAREHDELEVLGWAEGGYASVAWLDGAGERTLDHALRGLEIAERLGSAMSRSLACTQLARAHLALGQFPEAREAAASALEVARSTGTGLQLEGLNLAHRSTAELGTGDVDRALSTAEEAVAVCTSGHNVFFEAFARLELARALFETDDEDRQDRVSTKRNGCGGASARPAEPMP